MKIVKTCEICNSTFTTYHNGRFCSAKCWGISKQGIPLSWRVQEKYGYSAIHKWLKKSYGKPTHCENEKCIHRAKRIEWSLKKGFEYERKRENFWMLCASCHRKYDWTPEQTRKLSEIMKKRIFTPEIRRNMSLGQQGRIIPPNIRKIMSEQQRKRWKIRKSLGLGKFN